MADSKNPILIDSYIESAKLAQRAIYFSFVFAASLCFVLISPDATTKVPIFGYEAPAPVASIAVLGLYMASGVVLFFAVKQCSRIQAYEFKGSLDLKYYPSFIHAGGFIRLCAMAGPWVILANLFQGLWALPQLHANAIALGFSVFHVCAYLLSFDWIAAKCRSWNREY